MECEHSSVIFGGSFAVQIETFNFKLIFIIGFCNRSHFQGQFITEAWWGASQTLKARDCPVEGTQHVAVICE